MTSRLIVACALLSIGAVACLNTSMPRSRQAVLDGVVPPPAATAAASSPVPKRAPDEAEVELLPVAGSSLGRARATVMVRAAVDKVRAVLLDFPSYPEFLPHYKSARVVGKTPEGATLVHMQIDALGGMIRRWMRVEVSSPVVDGPRETFGARLIEGDVKAFEARWELVRKPDGTLLTLESFLDANLTLPAAFIDSGSAAGLKTAILAVKARAEESGP
jgi:ribosome-associated toxin RatA of RatAB toxin-antitoxin module